MEPYPAGYLLAERSGDDWPMLLLLAFWLKHTAQMPCLSHDSDIGSHPDDQRFYAGQKVYRSGLSQTIVNKRHWSFGFTN